MIHLGSREESCVLIFSDLIKSITWLGDCLGNSDDNVEDDKKYKGDDDADDWMMTAS